MDSIPIRHLDHQAEPALSGHFGIRAVADILDGKDMVQELHRHDFFYILVLKNGQGEHEIDFVEYAISDRCLFLMRPGQVHKIHLKAGSTGFLLQFNPQFLDAPYSSIRESLRKVSHRNFCTLGGDDFPDLERPLDHILKEFGQKKEGYEEVIKASLHIFFIELLRYRKTQPDHPVAAAPYAQEKLEEFLDLVQQDVFEHKQASHYAQKLNLSAYQLSSITKSLLERTPSEVINDHIILESKRNLLATSMQVNQIAYHMGYDDTSYFIRFFRKHTGVSPESFRQNFR